MPSLVTDNFRMFAAQQFVESLEEPYTNTATPPTPTSDTDAQSQAYRSKIYLFIGRSQNWNDTSTTNAVIEKYEGFSTISDLNPPTPVDSIDELSEIYDDMIALKRVNRSDVCEVVRKRVWQKDIVYDMYKDDYGTLKTDGNIKLSSNGQSKLYNCNFYVMNSQFQVFKCIYNNQTVANPSGTPSTVEPTGTSTSIITLSDQYKWKYMYTITIPDYIKFVSTDFMPVRIDSAVQTAAVNGAIHQVVIEASGSGFVTANNGTYFVPVRGDNTDNCIVQITISSQSLTSATIATNNGTLLTGSNYSYGYLDYSRCYKQLAKALNESTAVSSDYENFVPRNIKITPIISPPGGHGSNALYELGAYRIMINKSLDFLDGEGDIPVDMQFRRFGLIEDPQRNGTSEDYVINTATACRAIKFSTLTFNGNFNIGEIIRQPSTGATGRVIHWDSINKVLRYYQNEYINGTQTAELKYKYIPFSGTSAINGSPISEGGSGITGAIPDTSFSNNQTITQTSGIVFANGYSVSEVKKFSGKILYVENRKPVVRSNDQIEDVKLVIEF